MQEQRDHSLLFPTGLPGLEWVEFEAAGFDRPVTGVIYRDGSAQPGVPLGGLGTGFIALGTDGTLDYYSTIFNAFLERFMITAPDDVAGVAFTQHRSYIPSLRLPFLGLAVGDTTWLLSLEKTSRFHKGVELAKQIHYWGHYPVVDLEFDLDAPVSASLRAWAPFYPGNAVSSNIPGAVFEVHLRNESETVQDGTLAFSFHGPRHREMVFNAQGRGQPYRHQAEYQRQEVSGRFAGVTVHTQWGDMPYTQTPSTLGSGTEPDACWYNQQLPADGQVYVHMVDRYWQVTGDDSVLEEYYPSIKAGINFMKTVDQDRDGLVDVKGSNQYYDSWPTMAGAAIHRFVLAIPPAGDRCKVREHPI